MNFMDTLDYSTEEMVISRHNYLKALNVLLALDPQLDASIGPDYTNAEALVECLTAYGLWAEENKNGIEITGLQQTSNWEEIAGCLDVLTPFIRDEASLSRVDADGNETRMEFRSGTMREVYYAGEQEEDFELHNVFLES
jgi:hypothetical protein